MKKSPFCDAAELTAWEHRGKPGEAFVYYQGGSFGRDTTYNKKLAQPTREAADVANRIRALSNLGRIDLTQRRLSSGPGSTFAYIATFRSTPSAPKRKEDELPFIKAFEDVADDIDAFKGELAAA